MFVYDCVYVHLSWIFVWVCYKMCDCTAQRMLYGTWATTAILQPNEFWLLSNPLFSLAISLSLSFFLLLSFLPPLTNVQYSLSRRFTLLSTKRPTKRPASETDSPHIPLAQQFIPFIAKTITLAEKGFMYGPNYELVPQIIIWLSLFQLLAKGCADTDLIYCMLCIYILYTNGCVCVRNNNHLFEQFKLKRFFPSYCHHIKNVVGWMKRRFGAEKKQFIYQNNLIDAKNCAALFLFILLPFRSTIFYILAFWFLVLFVNMRTHQWISFRKKIIQKHFKIRIFHK